VGDFWWEDSFKLLVAHATLCLAIALFSNRWYSLVC